MLENLNITNDKDLSLAINNNKKYHSIIIDFPIHNQDLLKPFNNRDMNIAFIEKLKVFFESINNKLENKSLLFIYGSPLQLMKVYEIIPQNFIFRYWIALEMLDTFESDADHYLKHNHLGLLMLSKNKQFLSLDTKNTRSQYIGCSVCKKNIKDWGGKKHLMNVKGSCLSDVWKDFYKVVESAQDPQVPRIELNYINYNKLAFDFNDDKMPGPILDRLLNLIKEEQRNILYVNFHKQFLNPLNQSSNLKRAKKIKLNSNHIKSGPILGDCIEEMKVLLDKFPNGLFDLVFADPPYNLDKKYKEYNDEISDKNYLDWCNEWLELCVKLTKPTGNILILNLPKWALEHCKLLNKIAYFQNWIVWDALSTPKGKMMPAHYALIYYTKSPKGFIYNCYRPIDSPEYCLRTSCVKARKRIGKNNVIPVSDVWWDVHRIKHKRDRDDHPCQLPDKLMNRIIQMFSNEGDIVFDPFGGAGTTAISAWKNNRKYITTELDPEYFNLINKQLEKLNHDGHLFRNTINRKQKSRYTKKELELKVQNLALEIAKIPTWSEFKNRYPGIIEVEVKKLYPKIQRLLKTAKLANKKLVMEEFNNNSEELFVKSEPSAVQTLMF